MVPTYQPMSIIHGSMSGASSTYSPSIFMPIRPMSALPSFVKPKVVAGLSRKHKCSILPSMIRFPEGSFGLVVS